MVTLARKYAPPEVPVLPRSPGLTLTIPCPSCGSLTCLEMDLAMLGLEDEEPAPPPGPLLLLGLVLALTASALVAVLGLGGLAWAVASVWRRAFGS